MVKLFTDSFITLTRGNLWTSGGALSPSAPDTPTGFAAIPGDQEIVLSWDAQPEADAFEIHYGTTDVIGAASVLTTSATGTGFTFDSTDSIQVGEKYYFWISAINGEGSAFSSSVTARSYVTVANSETVNVTTPSGSWTIATVLFSAAPVGVGMQIQANSTSYDFDGADWIDLNTFSTGNGDVISGAFAAVNNSGSSFTFWNTEP